MPTSAEKSEHSPVSPVEKRCRAARSPAPHTEARARPPRENGRESVTGRTRQNARAHLLREDDVGREIRAQLCVARWKTVQGRREPHAVQRQECARGARPRRKHAIASADGADVPRSDLRPRDDPPARYCHFHVHSRKNAWCARDQNATLRARSVDDVEALLSLATALRTPDPESTRFLYTRSHHNPGQTITKM